MYRGRSFGDLFSSYAAASSRPLLLSEFGVDAYDAAALAVDEAAQATWTAALAALAANCTSAPAPSTAPGGGAAVPCAAAAVASGGVVFAYVDDWALGASVGGAARSAGGVPLAGAARPDLSPAVHSPCGAAVEAPSASAAGRTFDGAVNVEWYGLVGVARRGCGGAADVVATRAAYWRLRALWTAHDATEAAAVAAAATGTSANGTLVAPGVYASAASAAAAAAPACDAAVGAAAAAAALAAAPPRTRRRRRSGGCRWRTAR